MPRKTSSIIENRNLLIAENGLAFDDVAVRSD